MEIPCANVWITLHKPLLYKTKQNLAEKKTNKKKETTKNTDITNDHTEPGSTLTKMSELSANNEYERAHEPSLLL